MACSRPGSGSGERVPGSPCGRESGANPRIPARSSGAHAGGAPPRSALLLLVRDTLACGSCAPGRLPRDESRPHAQLHETGRRSSGARGHRAERGRGGAGAGHGGPQALQDLRAVEPRRPARLRDLSRSKCRGHRQARPANLGHREPRRAGHERSAPRRSDRPPGAAPPRGLFARAGSRRSSPRRPARIWSSHRIPRARRSWSRAPS